MIPTNSTRFFAIGSINSLVPLPIELLEFKGQTIGSNIELSWRVATEVNNDYFSIERSSDGESWNVLGQIKGAGNSDVETTYRFTDQNPLRGNSYYRLKQTDFDGKSEYFSPIAISFEGRYKSKVYPNPADKYMNVEVADHSGNVSLYNLSGKLLFQTSVKRKSLQIDTSELKEGLYILQVNQHKQTISIRH
jgi:hypothetical protein